LEQGGKPDETDHDGHGDLLDCGFRGDGANDPNLNDHPHDQPNLETHFETRTQTHYDRNDRWDREGGIIDRDRPNRKQYD
jgi:hypothetical protein